MKPTPEQVAAAKAYVRGTETPMQYALLRGSCMAIPQNYVAMILLTALEAAEQDSARLGWLDTQGDAVYYDGERGTVWMVDTDEECCDSVRAAIDAARREEKP